jgi:chromosomal replication initiation ATPase DnaA
LSPHLGDDEYRRWFSPTVYASDSGDQITVWVPTESGRQHLLTHYGDLIDRALRAMNRYGTTVRFVVTGFDDDEDGDGEL